MKLTNWFFAFGMLVAFTVQAETASVGESELSYSRQADIQHYVSLVESGKPTMLKEAAQNLEWAGLDDPRIFDPIEQEVLALHAKGEQLDKYQMDLMAWLIKALSFSGQDKYLATVEKVAKENDLPKVKKYAKLAQPNFPQYKKWNPIINSVEKYNEKETAEINRFANMLRSDDFELMRLAAKRIHYKHIYNPFLLSVLAEKVKAMVSHEPQNGTETDAIAWMTKALAGSREEQYKPVVEDMAKNAKYAKLKSYAKKYLKYYQR
ncbi:hypothetical protein TDB9533_04221 [Thalassocella blandensis]|nr:hypothetical protein TDB9533_04221 [Thalassocella blandensis]